MPRGELGLETAAHDVAELEDALVGEAIEDERAPLAPRHEAQPVQQAEVLGDVRLAEPRAFDELSDGALAVAQGVQELQARRFGERLETFGHEREQFRR